MFQLVLVYLTGGYSLLSVNDKAMLRIPFASSNVIAAIFVAILVEALIKFEFKISNILAILISLIGLVLSDSRGALMLVFALALFISTRGALRIKNISKRFLLLLLIGLVVVIAANLLFQNARFVEFLSGYLGYGDFNSLTSRRAEVWEYALQRFLSAPVLGTGIYYDQSMFIGSTGLHNIVLELLAESGFVGAALYLFPLAHICKIALKTPGVLVCPQNAKMLAILVALFLNSLFEVVYFNFIFDVIFWLYAGFLMSSCRETADR